MSGRILYTTSTADPYEQALIACMTYVDLNPVGPILLLPLKPRNKSQ